MFRAGKAPEGAVLMADVIGRAVARLQVGVRALERNGAGTVLEACVQAQRLEEEGDSLYHEWLGRLFEGDPDPLDDIEDAANVLESISIKHARAWKKPSPTSWRSC